MMVILPLCIEKMLALSQQEFIWLFGQSLRDSVLRKTVPLKSVRLINRKDSTSLSVLSVL